MLLKMLKAWDSESSNFYYILICYRYLNEEDNAKTRDLMIHISKYNIMAKYIAPLFCMAVDDKYILGNF